MTGSDTSGPAGSGSSGVLTLRDALDDPALTAAHPTVLAGWAHLDAPIRWVHTSELLEIAELLTGGEMILVAGVFLTDSTPERMRAYIDSLADVGAVALAVETPRFGSLPTPLIEHALERDFPLIALGEVVRFVDITRAINSRLVSESVRALQFNDDVTHRLAGVLAAQGNLEAMVNALRDVTGCSIIVRSASGAVLATATVPDARPPSYARVAGIESAGVTIATLEVLPRSGVDLQMVEAACRRAPEPLALALLRWQPLTRSDQHVREIFRLLAADSGRLSAEAVRSIRAAAAAIGFDAPGKYVGVVAISVDGPLQTTELATALRSDDRTVLSEVRNMSQQSIIRCGSGSDSPGTDSHSATDELAALLRTHALPGGLRIGITEPVDDIVALAPSMAVARTAARSATVRDWVALARDVTLTHFLGSVDDAAVDAFLAATLGPLLGTSRTAEFIETLVMVHRTGSRVAAAKALNIHRQTMYQRLDRITTLLGGLPEPTSAAYGALVVAAEMALVRYREPPRVAPAF